MADDLHPGQRSSAVILGGRSRGGDAQFLNPTGGGQDEEGARLNRVADHVGGSLLAFRADGHSFSDLPMPPFPSIGRKIWDCLVRPQLSRRGDEASYGLSLSGAPHSRTAPTRAYL
jgi:hypothetical protein